MNLAESYRDKIFVVEDQDARIRREDDLAAFVPAAAGQPASASGFLIIPRGAAVRIDAVRLLETGAKKAIVFGFALDAADGRPLGWTSTRNLRGRFLNETIGSSPTPASRNQFGPNAAWAGGNCLGQVDLALLVANDEEIERLALNTLDAYFALVAAGAAEDVPILLNSGFRSWPEQKLLHDGFTRRLPGFNRAAKPGFSNHQNGIAFDISVAGGDGNPTYEWLKRHATGFGFVRTVTGEPWHWEQDATRANEAARRGAFRTANVRD